MKNNKINSKKHNVQSHVADLRFAANNPPKPLCNSVNAFLKRHEAKLIGATLAAFFVALPLQFVFPPIWLVPTFFSLVMIAKAFMGENMESRRIQTSQRDS